MFPTLNGFVRLGSHKELHFLDSLKLICVNESLKVSPSLQTAPKVLSPPTLPEPRMRTSRPAWKALDMILS